MGHSINTQPKFLVAARGVLNPSLALLGGRRQVLGGGMFHRCITILSLRSGGGNRARLPRASCPSEMLESPSQSADWPSQLPWLSSPLSLPPGNTLNLKNKNQLLPIVSNYNNNDISKSFCLLPLSVLWRPQDG